MDELISGPSLIPLSRILAICIQHLGELTGRYDQFRYEYTLYKPNRKNVDYTGKPYNLVDVLSNFDRWLKEHVVAYIEGRAAPDQWQLFLKGYSDDNSSSKFTEAEIARIEKGLDEFPKFLLERSAISPDKCQTILEEHEELKKTLRTEPKRNGLSVLCFFL